MSLLWLLLSIAHAAPADDPWPTASASASQVEAGRKVYRAHCLVCHGKKGTGPIGANFAEDTERMSRPDAELLASIRDGKAGEVGQMPPMGAAVDEDQRFQALAYIRAAFAPAPTTTPKGSTP